MLERTVLVEILYFEGLREILAEEMRGAGLEGFAVAHHGLDRVGEVGAGELFGVGFDAGDDRNCRLVYGEIRVNV